MAKDLLQVLHPCWTTLNDKMSIEVGSLSYVSTLNNDDFQSKSLQDIKLITTRLQLTGDTTGIEKYAAAFKAAGAAEKQIQQDLNNILEEARQRTLALADVINAAPSKTIFSDSAAEVEAYAAGLQQLESGASIVADLNAQLDALSITQQELNANFTAGLITEEELSTGLEEINVQQLDLVTSIERTNAFFADSVTVMAEYDRAIETSVVANEELTVSLETEIGLVGELNLAIKNLTKSRIGADASQLPIINKQLEEAEVALAAFKNSGTTGFNEFGEAVETAEAKSSKLSATVARLTNIDNLASRVLTQFTRQIISLGVGFLSLEIGAKAIESLVKYIQNLDTFTGRLDVARQTLEAFQAAELEGDKSAAPLIANLEVLYDKTQNLTLSMQERVRAAETLRDQYPAEFQNLSDLAILNGKASDSFNKLKDSILETALSTAAVSKITEAAGKILEAQTAIADAKVLRNKNIQAAQGLPTQANNANSDALLINPRQNAIDEANASYQQTLKVQSGTVTTQTQVVKNLEQFVTSVSKAAKDLDDANKLLGDKLQNFNSLIDGSHDKQQLENIKNALQTKLNALAPNDSQIAQIRADLQKVDDLIKDTYTVKPSKSTDPALAEAQALGARQLQIRQQEQATKDKYASDDLTREQKAVAAIVASFKSQNDAVAASNVKYNELLQKRGQAFIDSYNKNPKNANKISLLTPTPQSDIDAATAGVKADFNVEAIKQQAAQEKAVFQEYEDYKIKAGKQAADAIFGNDTKGFDTYIDYLKSLTPTAEQLSSTDPVVKATASKTQDALTKLNADAQKDRLVQQSKYLDQLVLNEQDYLQKTQTLIEVANQNIATLQTQVDKAKTDQSKQFYLGEIQQVRDNLSQQITAIQIAGFEQQVKYKALYDNLGNTSTQSANEQITALERSATAALLFSNLSHDAYIKIIKDLEALREAANNKDFDKLIAVGNGLSEIGKSLESINGGLGAQVSALGGIATSIGNVGKAYNKMVADEGDANQHTIDEISLIATGASSLISLIGGIVDASAKRKQDAEDYYNSVIAFQNAYNLALIQQEQIQYKTDGNIFIENYSKELSDAAKAYHDATSSYNQSLIALQAGQAIVGQKDVVNGKNVASSALSGATTGAVVGSLVGGPVGTLVGAGIGGVVGALAGLFGGKSKANVLTPLLQQYPQLIEANGKFNESLAKTLIANNQVSDATKTLLNNTIGYYDEEQAAIDQINTALTSLSDGLGQNLEDALVTAFENGSDAATAFGNTVSGVISNIVSQFLFEDIFGSQFDKLNDALKATVLAGGGSADITKDFVDFFKDAGPLVQEFQDGLKAAQAAGATQGLTLFPPSSGSAPTTLQGQITASLTEATGDILAGTLKGIQLNTYNTNNILEGHSLSFGQMVSIAQDQLASLLSIQLSSQTSADNSVSMLSVLKSINTNTGNSAGTELRAAGFYGY